jgi:hypothetical protein
MIILPFAVGPGMCSIFVLLGDENIERIKEYDPAEVTLNKLPEPWVHMKVKDVVIGYATDAESLELVSCRDSESRQEALKRLMRGWKFRPDKGDNDDPYKRVESGG